VKSVRDMNVEKALDLCASLLREFEVQLRFQKPFELFVTKTLLCAFKINDLSLGGITLYC